MRFKNFASALMGAALFCAGAAHANTVAVTTTTPAVALGDSIAFDLSLDLSTATYSGWVDISYDNSLLSFTGTSNLSSFWDTINVSDSGSVVTIYFESMTSETATNTVLTLGFDTLDAGLGSLGIDNHGASVSFLDVNSHGISGISYVGADYTITAVPVPAAVWLFGSGLLGLVGVARRRTA